MNDRPVAALLQFDAACSPSAASPPPPLQGARIGGPFTLVDQDGRTVTDRSFAGKYRIMYFGYTFCPDVCPTDMQAIGQAMKLLKASDPALARRIVPIFVTVDPARDTPAQLKAFTAAFGPDIVGLTGTPAQIAAAAKAYAISYRREGTTAGGYLMGHSRSTYLMSPDNAPLALLPSDEGADKTLAEIERWAS